MTYTECFTSVPHNIFKPRESLPRECQTTSVIPRVFGQNIPQECHTKTVPQECHNDGRIPRNMFCNLLPYFGFVAGDFKPLCCLQSSLVLFIIALEGASNHRANQTIVTLLNPCLSVPHHGWQHHLRQMSPQSTVKNLGANHLFAFRAYCCWHLPCMMLTSSEIRFAKLIHYFGLVFPSVQLEKVKIPSS